MTPEQQALADKLTNLQRLTVLGVVAGKTQRQAYYDAGGKAASDESADSAVCTMLSNAKVKAFYDAMMEAAAENAIWTRNDSLRELASIALGQDPEAKTSDRVNAIKALNAMEGFDAPAKIAQTDSAGNDVKPDAANAVLAALMRKHNSENANT